MKNSNFYSHETTKSQEGGRNNTPRQGNWGGIVILVLLLILILLPSLCEESKAQETAPPFRIEYNTHCNNYKIYGVADDAKAYLIGNGELIAEANVLEIKRDSQFLIQEVIVQEVHYDHYKRISYYGKLFFMNYNEKLILIRSIPVSGKKEKSIFTSWYYSKPSIKN